MPMTRRQFELGVGPETEGLMRRVYEFLSANRELAYTRDELSREFEGNNGSDLTDLGHALRALEDVRAVEAREVRGEWHYALYKEVDSNTWEPI